MRLVCPNCSAQYEIDGSMIPDEGRDVQCSNCGHTWFELPGPRGAELSDIAAAEETRETAEPDEFDSPGAYDINDDESFEDETEGAAPETTRQKSRPENLSRAEFEDDGDQPEAADGFWEEDTGSETEAEAPDTDQGSDERTSAAVRAVTAAAEAADDEGTEGDVVAEEETAPSEATPDAAGAPKQRRPADAAALDILREEAERELTQRRTPPSEPIETQPDLGLEAIRNRKTPSRALRARMAHMGDEVPEAAEETPEARGTHTRLMPEQSRPAEPEAAYEEPRRDLLPDIDEINSTLKATPAGARDPDAAKRSGFRSGFLLMLFLAIAAIFAYAQAPAIARALPNIESAMISYVDWANGLRDRIDGLIGN